MTFDFLPQACMKTSLLSHRSRTLGAGVRYNINDQYSFSGGLNYVHYSNGYLAQPAFFNYGINVYGPTWFDVRLGKLRHHGSE